MRKLEHDESLIRSVRRHPLVFLIQVLFIALLAIAPPALLALAGLFFDLSGILAFAPVVVFGYSLWLAALWIFSFIAWTDYYLDVWDITTKRIIDFEYKGFFRYETTTIKFEKIQDITVEVNGLLANIFKFGNLRVQTAGETSHEFVIRDVGRPEEIKRLILKQYSEVAALHHVAAV